MTKFKFSTVSFVCIMALAFADGASAAGSVRRLGGTGTYNGTVSAARGATSARAGSLRISPSKTRSLSTSTRVNSDGTTTPTERLSLGRYLGGATTVSSSTPSESVPVPADVTNITNQINELYEITNNMETEINNKQDVLTAGDYILIENDEVSLDITELEDYLTNNLHLENPVDIRYNNTTDVLEWTKDGTTWTTLLNIADLLGDYVTVTDLQNAINGIVIPEQQQADWAETDNTKPSFIANKPTNLVTTDDLIDAIDGIVVPEQQQSDWAETDTASTAFIQNKPDLSNFATLDDLNNMMEGMPAAQVQADWNETSEESMAFIQNKPTNLATTDDLTNYQVKPSSGVAAGKVLTYTGNDANANVAASYVTVPVATAAPSTVAPTGFVEMWVSE